MANIFFDARYIRPDSPDGIGRFTASLFAAFSRISGVTAIISDERQLDQLPKGSKFVKIHAPTSALEPLTALILNRYKPDVVFSPMQTMGSLGKRFKLVLTIHDLIYYRHPQPPKSLPALVRFGWRIYHLTFIPQRLLLAGCDAVACVSSTTAADVEKHKLTKKPVAIIYNAPDRRIGKLGERRAKKSLVYMGSFMGYKNVETLISGTARLSDYTLHLLSRITPGRRAALEKLAGLEGASVVFHDGVSDEEYRNLLDKSTALVSASLDEGFGIPVVEAMSQGVPVVLSDIPIFHEVAGEAGRYFDPSDADDFAKTVRGLARKKPTGRELVERAAIFDWDESAKNLKQLIDSL